MNQKALTEIKGVAKSLRKASRGMDRLHTLLVDDGQAIAVDFSAGWNAGFSAARQTYCDEPSEQQLYDCLFAARDIITDGGGEPDWERDFQAILDRQDEAVTQHDRGRNGRCPICGGNDVYDYEGPNRGCRDCKSHWRDPAEAPPPDEVVEALETGSFMMSGEDIDVLKAAVRRYAGYESTGGSDADVDWICETSRKVQEMDG